MLPWCSLLHCTYQCLDECIQLISNHATMHRKHRDNISGSSSMGLGGFYHLSAWLLPCSLVDGLLGAGRGRCLELSQQGFHPSAISTTSEILGPSSTE
jgi:hypothetical protein